MGGGALSSNVSKLGSKEVSKVCHLERSARSQSSEILRLAPQNDRLRHAELVSASQLQERGTFSRNNKTLSRISKFTSFTKKFNPLPEVEGKCAFTLAEGATHVDTCDGKRKIAFTLAEVLITLGIIGVVMALTIPNAISSYKKKVLETRFEKLYSTLNQALVMSQVENGECSGWEFGSFTEHRNHEIMKAWWKKYFEPYLREIIQAEVSAKNNSNNGAYRVYFNDGSSVRLEALPGDYARIVLYPNAKKINRPELITLEDKAGKDYFMFFLRASSCKFVPATSEKSNSELVKSCLNDYNSFISTNASGGACAELIIRNGWKIPNDYPIKL